MSSMTPDDANHFFCTHKCCSPKSSRILINCFNASIVSCRGYLWPAGEGYCCKSSAAYRTFQSRCILHMLLILFPGCIFLSGSLCTPRNGPLQFGSLCSSYLVASGPASHGFPCNLCKSRSTPWRSFASIHCRH
jgi:hypothetical protein